MPPEHPVVSYKQANQLLEATVANVQALFKREVYISR